MSEVVSRSEIVRVVGERPRWCPHPDCVFKRSGQDVVCGGTLPLPSDHDGVANTHRICFNGAAENGGVLDLKVNPNDLDWFRFIFDALDGKASSWLSQRRGDSMEEFSASRAASLSSAAAPSGGRDADG